MAKNANLYIRIDQEVKSEAEQLFSNFGITVTDAVNIFLRKAIMVGGLPFDVRMSIPNAETLAAMQEIENMKKGQLPKQTQSVESLFKELEINVDC